MPSRSRLLPRSSSRRRPEWPGREERHGPAAAETRGGRRPSLGDPSTSSAGGAQGPARRRSSSPVHLFEASHQGRHGSVSPARASSPGSGAGRAPSTATSTWPSRSIVSRLERSIQARLGRPRSEHDGEHVESRGAGRPQGQQRVVDRAEPGSRRDQQRHPQVRREVAHQVGVVQGHRSPPTPSTTSISGWTAESAAHALEQGRGLDRPPGQVGGQMAVRRGGRSAAGRPPRPPLRRRRRAAHRRAARARAAPRSRSGRACGRLGRHACGTQCATSRR